MNQKVLEGQIKVAVRVRPLIAREKAASAKIYWKTDRNTIRQQDPETKSFSLPFAFDHVFPMEATTAEVYTCIGGPIIKDFMKGFNGTIFAYGQTSSGKTYTMNGDSVNPGFIPMAVEEIFNFIEESPDREFVLRVSFMEIYREQVLDLLQENGAVLKVAENENNEVFVKNLTETNVITPRQILDLMKRGEKNRTYGETNMNERSSRSHTIFRIIVESKEESEGDDCAVTVSQLNLVDLAGSEKVAQTGAQGDRFKEGCNINKSLSTLALVIKQLSEGAPHVNYRDCKLTRILQNSLGGNSLTAIICAVTPAGVSETISTLCFASQAKRIKNKALVNEVLNDQAQLKRQKKEIATLQKALEVLKSTTNIAEVEKTRVENEALRTQLKKLKELVVCSSHSPLRIAATKLPRGPRRHTLGIPAIHREAIRAAVEMNTICLPTVPSTAGKKPRPALSIVSEGTEEPEDVSKTRDDMNMSEDESRAFDALERGDGSRQEEMAYDASAASPPLTRRVQELRCKSTGRKAEAAAGHPAPGDATPEFQTPRLVLRERNVKLVGENVKLNLRLEILDERLKELDIERKNEEELAEEAVQLEEDLKKVRAEKESAVLETKKQLKRLLKEAGLLHTLGAKGDDEASKENRAPSTPTPKLKRLLEFLDADKCDKADASFVEDQGSELGLHEMKTPQAIRCAKAAPSDSVSRRVAVLVAEKAELIEIVDNVKLVWEREKERGAALEARVRELEAAGAGLEADLRAAADGKLFQEELIRRLEGEKKSMRASLEEERAKVEAEDAAKLKEEVERLTAQLAERENTTSVLEEKLKRSEEQLSNARAQLEQLLASSENELKSSLSQLQQKYSEATKKLESLASSSESAQQRVVQLSEALAESEASRKSLESASDAMESTLRKISLELEASEDRVKKTTSACDLLRDTNEALSNSLSKLTEEKALLDKFVVDQTSLLEQLEAEKVAVSERVRSLEEDLSNARASVEQLRLENESIPSLRFEIASLKIDLEQNDVAGQLEAKNSEIASFKTRIQELQDLEEKLSRTVSDLEQRLKTKEDEIGTLKVNLEQQNDVIGQLEAKDLEIRSFKTQLLELQNREEKLRLTVSDLEERLKMKEDEVSKLLKAAEDLKCEITTLQSSGLASEVVEKLTETTRALEHRVSGMEAAAKSKDEDLVKASEEIVSLNSRITELQRAEEETCRKLVEEKEELAKSTSGEISRLEAVLETRSEDVSKLAAEVREKTRSVETLREQLKVAESALEKEAFDSRELRASLDSVRFELEQKSGELSQMISQTEDLKKAVVESEKLCAELESVRKDLRDRDLEVDQLKAVVSDLNAALELKPAEVTLTDVHSASASLTEPSRVLNFDEVELVSKTRIEETRAVSEDCGSQEGYFTPDEDEDGDERRDVLGGLSESLANRTGIECVVGDTMSSSASQDPLRLTNMSVVSMSLCSVPSTERRPRGARPSFLDEDASFFHIAAESTRFDALRATNRKGRRTENFEADKQQLLKELAEVKQELEKANQKRNEAEEALEVAEEKCDIYREKINTLNVYLLAANDGGLAPVDSTSACVQTSMLLAPETPGLHSSAGRRRMRSAACSRTPTSPGDDDDDDDASTATAARRRRKTCIAALNQTIGALNRTGAVVGLAPMSRLDDEDGDVAIAEVISALKDELLLLRDKLETDVPAADELESLRSQLAVKAIEIEARIKATLEVEIKADDVSRLLEYECIKEREKTEFVWRVQEEVNGTWFSENMADSKIGGQLANLKAHMEDEFNRQRQEEFDRLTEILARENERLESLRGSAAVGDVEALNEQMSLLEAEKEKALAALADKEAELREFMTNRDRDYAEFKRKLEDEVKEFVPRLKRNVENEVTDRLEQEWHSRLAAYKAQNEELRKQMASSKGQLDSVHSLDQAHLQDDLAAVQEQLEAVTREKTEHESRNAALRADVRRLEESLAATESLRESLEAECRTANAACDKASARLTEVEAKLRAERGLVESLQSKNELLEEAAAAASWRDKENEARVREMKVEVEEEKRKLLSAREEMRVHFEQQTAELETLRREVEERKAQLVARSELEEEERAAVLLQTVTSKTEEVSRLTALVIRQKAEFEAERVSLEDKASAWRRRHADVEADKTGLTGRLSELKDAFDALSEAKRELEARFASAEAQVAALETEVARLGSDLETANASNASLRKELETEKSNVSCLTAAKSSLETENSRLNRAVTDLETHKTDLLRENDLLKSAKSRLEDDKAGNLAAMSTLTEEKTKLERENSRLVDNLSRLDAEIRHLKTDLARLETGNSQLSEEKRRLETALDAERTSASTSEAAKLELEKELDAAKAEFSGIKTALEKELADKTAELTRVKDFTEALVHAREKVEIEREELLVRCRALEEDARGVAQVVDGLRTELSDANAAKEAESKLAKERAFQLAELTARTEAMEKEVSDRDRILDAAQKEILVFRERMRRLQKMVEDRDKQLAEVKAQNEASVHEIEQVKRILDRRSNELRAAHEEIVELRAAIEANKQRIAQLDEECTEYENEMEKANSFRKQYALELEKLKAEHAQLEKEKSELVQKNEELEKECNQIDEDLFKANEDRKQKALKIAELEKHSKADGRLKELEDSVKAYRAENRSLYKKISALQTASGNGTGTTGNPSSSSTPGGSSGPAPLSGSSGSGSAHVSAADVKLLREENELLRRELRDKNRQWREMKAEVENARAGKVRPTQQTPTVPGYNLRRRGNDD